MSILLNRNSKVLVQGITGRSGQFHAKMCREYGTQIVAGVTPGRGGIHIEGTPVFNTVAEAVKITGANVSMIFVPPPYAADAILESADAELDLAICITEGIPVRDMVPVKRILTGTRCAWSDRTAQASSPPASAKSASCPDISTSRVK